MKLAKLFKGIRSRLVVMSILPVIVVAVILSSFSLSSRYQDLSDALSQSGKATVSYIAATAELSMYAEDREGLEKLGNSALSTPAVAGIGFFDRNEEMLAIVGNDQVLANKINLSCLDQNGWEHGLLWYFCQPVTESLKDVSDFGPEQGEDAGNPAQNYGWVVLALSRENLIAQQNNNIRIMLLVALLATVSSALMALRIAKGIADPVMALSETVGELESGHYHSRALIQGPRETRLLARGVNNLAKSVADARERLEARIADATSQLTTALEHVQDKNADLEKTQQDLQQAMAAKDQFLARMSHELRTPLTAVSGFTQLLSKAKHEHERREYINNITSASSLLLGTIDGILNFSRLQNEAISVESIEFDLREAMESLIAMHSHQAFRKSLELVLMIDTDVPDRIISDPTCIKQIVNNLLTNAIKFTDKGQVVLRISSQHHIGRPATLDFEVRDSGVGISHEQMKRLFKPFTQADDSITRRYGGTGLGLAICKQLSNLLQGEINIESQPGEGSCATITLPLQISDHSLDSSHQYFSQQLRILAYDSNPWSLRALRAQLSRWTHNVFTAYNEDQLNALLRHQDQPFDLVVLGLNNQEVLEPGLSSWLTKIRRDHSGPLLLLACTNHYNAGIDESTRINFEPIWGLSKPLRLSVLSDFMKSLLDQPKAATEEPANQQDQRLSGLNILIAEDNQYNRRLIEVLIQSMGATTVTANNGAEAVKHFQSAHFDAVILDVHMPVMDGVTATKKIAALAGEQGIPILGLTANVMETERRALLDAGAVDILYKPIDENRLATTIAEFAGQNLSPAQHHDQMIAQTASKQELFEECDRLVSAVDQAINLYQLDQAGENLHELIGLSGIFKLHEVREHAMILHNALKDRDYPQLAPILAELRSVIAPAR